LLGPAVNGIRAASVGTAEAGYPADGSVVRAAALVADSSGCKGGRAPDGSVQVRALSLFDGAVEAAGVALLARKSHLRTGVDRLEVGGKAAAAGTRVPLGNWGYVFAAKGTTDAGTSAAIAVHLTQAHAGLPAGSALLVGYGRVPPKAVPPPPAAPKAAGAAKPAAAKPAKARTVVIPKTKAKAKASAPKRAHRAVRVDSRKRQHARKRHHRRKRKEGQPLKVTPPLGGSGYVFPVTGVADYADTYGGFRGDVPGNWHHGDDIFASLGTPVVAVADGTLNRVGWQRLGGWRLWVRDHYRNQFYYAHLSGYSPLALESKRIHAGDVIGFIGNTGDAFTTSPHLHFEIHPHQLLQLDYNGAVNPTSYLESWRRVGAGRVPNPAHPAFPPGPVRAETRFVWRELLAARGLITNRPPAEERPRIAVRGQDSAAGFARRSGRRLAASPLPVAAKSSESPVEAVRMLVELAVLALAAGASILIRRRRRGVPRADA